MGEESHELPLNQPGIEVVTNKQYIEYHFPKN